MIYTVGEMAQKLGVPASTLRYYDKEGLLPFVERSSGGIRMFRENDFEWLQVIRCMKKAGMSIKNAEKVNGVWEQRLRIHYNCVGTIEIPSALPLPTPDVSVNTRKGVVVNYAPCDVAI